MLVPARRLDVEETAGEITLTEKPLHTLIDDQRDFAGGVARSVWSSLPELRG